MDLAESPDTEAAGFGRGPGEIETEQPGGTAMDGPRSTTEMCRKQRPREGGIVLVLVAALLGAMVGFVSLGVTIGYLNSARTSSQAIADAAALAGAFTFITNPQAGNPIGLAESHARRVAGNNHIMGQLIEPVEEVDVNVDVGNRRVRVDVSTQQPTLFAALFGPDSASIGARAIAEAGSTVGSDPQGDNRPWFVPNNIFATPQPGDLCGGCDGSQLLIHNGATTEFAASLRGQAFVIKPGSPHDAMTPGTFYAIQGSSLQQGAEDYRTNIELGIEAACFDSYSVETGNMIGPTAQGTQDFIHYPDQDVWLGPDEDNVFSYLNPRTDPGTVSDVSDSWTLVPIWDTCAMGTFCIDGQFAQGTNVTLQVVGFAFLFIEDVQANDVIARLIDARPCHSQPGAAAGGSTIFGYPLRLVRLPQTP